MTNCSPTSDAVTCWPRVRSEVHRRRVVLLILLFFAVPVAATEPGDFHDLSPQERSTWLDDLGKVLGESASVSKEPDAPAPPPAALPFAPWRPSSHQKTTWTIDPNGFVLLADGQRPMGSRIFARSCYLQHSDSFRRWAGAYAQNPVAHLVATAITESGCSEMSALGSVDGKSTGLMQVTGYTCQFLLPLLGMRPMTEKECMSKMADDTDFSIKLAAAYITTPAQLKLTDLDPPKVAAAYNAGGLYFDPGNSWRLRSTGNHIDRFVSAYNAYVSWQRDEHAGRRTRSPAVHLTRGMQLPKAVSRAEDLKPLSSLAKDGDIVFVGDPKKRRGDFYVFVAGTWRGSLEDSEK